MNRKENEECVSKFLDKVIVNGVQDPGLSPFEVCYTSGFFIFRYPLQSRLEISLSRHNSWNPEEQRFIIPDAGLCGGERNSSWSKFS